MDRHTNSIYLPNKPKASMFTANVRYFPYLKLTSYTKDTGNVFRMPPDCTGNEPTPDAHIEGSGQGIKNIKDKYMSFEMNMLIMYHVYYLSKEMEGNKPTKVLRSTTKTTNFYIIITVCQL